MLLLRAYGESGASYRRELARHFVRWDLEGPHLLDELSQPFCRLTLAELARNSSSGLPREVLEDRLSRILPFYEAAGLVTREGDRFVANNGQIRAARAPNPLPRPSREEFVLALLDEYDQLTRSRSSPVVPIPLLERAVADRFGGRLWSDEFRTMLSTLPQETPEYVMHFSQPMSREPMGIRVAGRYFYYVQIHRRR